MSRHPNKYSQYFDDEEEEEFDEEEFEELDEDDMYDLEDALTPEDKEAANKLCQFVKDGSLAEAKQFLEGMFLFFIDDYASSFAQIWRILSLE